MESSARILKMGRGVPLPKRRGGWGDGRSYFGEGVVDGLLLFGVGEGVGGGDHK